MIRSHCGCIVLREDIARMEWLWLLIRMFLSLLPSSLLSTHANSRNRPAANQSRTFETYKALAQQAQVNLGGDGLPSGAPAPGGNTTVPTPSDPNNPSQPGGGNGVGGGNSGTPTDGSLSPTGTGATLPGNTGAAASLRVGVSAMMGGVAALGFAVLL
jgi:hypothetical protein